MILGVLIIPKLRINDFWSIAIFFSIILERQKGDRIWTLGPRIYDQKLQKVQETYGDVFEMFFQFLESEIMSFVEGLCT